MISKSIMSAAVLVALASAPAVAQQVIYPAKGQSAEQQQKDEAECYAIRGSRRVMTRRRLQSPCQRHRRNMKGSGLEGAARGAAGGAVIGAIAGDAGKGAAIGAAGGTVAGSHRQRRKQEDYQQGASQQQQAAAQ